MTWMRADLRWSVTALRARSTAPAASASEATVSAWPSKASREPRSSSAERSLAIGAEETLSIWQVLGVSRDVTEAELKAAYRRRALETHPDHGGDEAAFRRVLHAYDEAKRRLRKPRPRRAT